MPSFINNVLNKFFVLIFLTIYIAFDSYCATLTESTQSSYTKDTITVRELNTTVRAIVATSPDEAFLKAKEAYTLSQKISYAYGEALSLNGMGIAMYYNNNNDMALKYYQQSLAIYKTLNDYYMEATLYANIGNVYQIQGDYKKALENLKASLTLSEKNNLSERTATTLGSLGILYYDNAEYAAALNAYLKALKIREQLNDKQGIAYTLGNIGLIYDDQAQYEKALEYYRKSLAILNEINDQNGLAATLNNMGLIYSSLNNADTALSYYNKSLEIALKIANKSIIRSCYNNIGDIYKSRQDFSKAIYYYELTQKINKELNDTKSTAITLSSIADLHKMQKNYAKALSGFQESLKLSELSGDKVMIKENYKNLSAVYALMENYKEAYNNFQKFYELNEELFRESQNQLSEIQFKYENERIQNEMDLLKKEAEVKALLLERNRIIIYAIVTGFLLLLLLFIIIFRANKLKTIANKKLQLQNSIIEKQKEELKIEKQRADNQILSIVKGDEVDNKNVAATINDYQMVVTLFKKLEKENTQSKFEILKSEVNPHFLFNSLNNLIGLIEENQSVAANYVQGLSNVYLYVLKSKEKELVELWQEINFVESYSFLLQRRFGSNIIFNINIDEAYFKQYVPPLCMELLIENAVKHNVITNEKPLTIDIYIEDEALVVQNNLQLKSIPEVSTKIGLQNIEKRYHFLTDRKVEISKTKRLFKVKLPLLDLA